MRLKPKVTFKRLLSNDACGRKNKGRGGTIRDIFLAKEEYLNAAFSAIDEQYKSADAFLHDGLNITQKTIEKFKGSVLL